MQKLKWRTEMRKISDLIPNPKNPRTMPEKTKHDLEKSITDYDLVELPVADADNRVIAGHQRLDALKSLGRGNELIPVRMPNRKLTPREYDGYLLLSNRLHGDFDWDKLAENYDLDTILASGFDDADLNLMFDDITVEDDEFNAEKEMKKIKEPYVKLGDLYEMRPHKIHCADSTDPASVKKLMGGKRASAILQDPPFNIGLSYQRGISGNCSYGGNTDDSKTDEEYEEFLRKALANGLSACAKDAHVFTYHDPRYTWLLQKLYRELGIRYLRTCLWIKNNSTPTPNVAFNRQYEPALYGVVGKPYLSPRAANLSEILNREVGSGNQTIDDIQDMFEVWLVKRLSGVDYSHPTEKPPSVHERPLRRCTKPNDIVLDPFSGSGSLMVACQRLKRIAYMVEREPIFVQLTLQRYEKLTGQKARKLN